MLCITLISFNWFQCLLKSYMEYKYLLSHGTEYNMDNVFRVQRFSAELFSEPLGEENKSRKSLNEENISILYEEPCDNSFIVNILFFICKSSYNVKNIDFTNHVAVMVVTANKTSKSYVINQFHFQRSNFTFL